jgi:phosphate transport system permease protein
MTRSANRRSSSRLGSVLGTGLTGAATALIVLLLLVILAYIAWQGRSAFSFRFLFSSDPGDPTDPRTVGLLPMILGTTARVLLMTVFVLPAGVITAIYLAEYTQPHHRLARLLRTAVNSLAGVPAIVFGLFGLGFFIAFLGGSLDTLLRPPDAEPLWGKPALLWASLTLAVMTLPVVITTSEEALRAVPQSLRYASFALGATRLQTLSRVVLPQALPGILTGSILAISRAAGEVAPILFTGAAYYMARLPGSLTDQFMDLGYHAFVLATQTPDLDATQPVLYATLLTLLALTLTLNILAIAIRAQRRSLAHSA